MVEFHECMYIVIIFIWVHPQRGGEGSRQMGTIAYKGEGRGWVGVKVAYVRKKKNFFGPQNLKTFLFLFNRSYYIAIFVRTYYVVVTFAFQLEIRQRQLNFLFYEQSGELFRVGRSAK